MSHYKSSEEPVICVPYAFTVHSRSNSDLGLQFVKKLKHDTRLQYTVVFLFRVLQLTVNRSMVYGFGLLVRSETCAVDS